MQEKDETDERKGEKKEKSLGEHGRGIEVEKDNAGEVGFGIIEGASGNAYK